MYTPPLFKQEDLPAMHALMRMHPLATWCTQADGALLVNHLPLLLDAERGEHGTLVGHVARANPVWKGLGESVFVFQGANLYVTPNWYATTHEHGKQVPTWNYAVVHAHGTPVAIDDKAWLLAMLKRMTDTHEAGTPQPWAVEGAPADYIDGMLEGIVGIEMPITRIEGKWKTSQNRLMQDREGVVSGLEKQGTAVAREMQAMVRAEMGK